MLCTKDPDSHVISISAEVYLEIKIETITGVGGQHLGDHQAHYLRQRTVCERKIKVRIRGALRLRIH